MLSPRGAARLDVKEFFSQQAAPAGVLMDDPVYVVVESNQELAGFEFVQPGSDLLGLNARPAAELLNALFFPQLAVLGPFETELVVVSLAEEEPVILTITAFQPDGVPFGAGDLQRNPVTRVLEAGEVLREDLEGMFGFAGESILDGWLRVESTSEAIHGAISYSIPALGSIASVASVASGTRSAVFSHIATTFNFFTGVAVLNGGKLVANVQIVAVKQDGTVLGSFRTTLAPGQRLSRTLTEMIPAAGDQAGGFILIKSDVPVFLTNVFGNLVSGVLSNVPPQPAPEEFEVETQTEPIEVSPPLTIVPVAGMQQFEVMGPAGASTWSVNGEEGGGAVQGRVDGTGRYTAPAQVPQALPVVVTARIGEDTTGASTDVLSREVLLGDLGIVQSVAYLSGLARVYTAELSLGAGPQKSVAGVSQSSTIFDVTAGLPAQVAEFAGEDIPKMIAFAGSDGKEYLLLAGRTTGRVIRLNPQTQQTTTVVTGLDEPVSLVLDPVSVSGDLLVAERDRVTRLAGAELNQGLAGAPAGVARRPLGNVIEGLTPAGVTVDRCTGDIYVSDSASGEVRKVERLSGVAVTAADDLADPGQLLGLYRSGISCPESFHLLITERGADRVLLLTSRIGPTEWVASPGIQDLALKEISDEEVPASVLPNQPGILLGEVTKQVGQVALVPVDLYERNAINPVAGSQLLTGIVGYSSNVRLLVSPPPAVGDEDLTDPDHVHVFLEKVLTLNQDLTPDTGEVIPAGSRIRSYFFHYDPPGTAGAVLDPGFMRFDAPILGVINLTETLDGTDALLGSSTTDYTGTVARVWAPPDLDFFEISEDGARLDFSAEATAGQDQLRALVASEGDSVDIEYAVGVTVTSLGLGITASGLSTYINNLGEVLQSDLGPAHLWLPTPAYGLPQGRSPLPLKDGLGLNDLGQVLGQDDDNEWIVWENGAVTKIPGLEEFSEVTAINNQGQITGVIYDEENEVSVAFRGSVQGNIVQFGQVGNVEEHIGYALNDQGNVVAEGGDDEGQDPRSLIFFEGSTGSILRTFDEGISIQQASINNSNEILVVTRTFGSSERGTLLVRGGQITQLKGLDGSDDVEAWGINDAGVIVGEGPAIWVDDRPKDVNDLIPDEVFSGRMALCGAINNLNQIVCSDIDGFGAYVVSNLPIDGTP